MEQQATSAKIQGLGDCKSRRGEEIHDKGILYPHKKVGYTFDTRHDVFCGGQQGVLLFRSPPPDAPAPDTGLHCLSLIPRSATSDDKKPSSGTMNGVVCKSDLLNICYFTE